MSRIGLHSERVLIEDKLQEATIVLFEGKIERIIEGKLNAVDFEIMNCGADVIMPGVIDPHVHINEPGRTEWEGFNTATRAAAAGGITTLVDMPLNSSPVTTNKKAFQLKLAAANNNLHVNCGFWGGIVPDNCEKISDILNSGVLGIKAFLTHSGIDEFPNVTKRNLDAAMASITLSGTPLLVHCELESPHEDEDLLNQNPTNYSNYLKSRPPQWEDEAIALMIELCEKYKTRTHIVHLSSSNSISSLEKAKARGLPITVETCPHYFFFNAADISNGDTRFKCAPPIREEANNVLLINALKSGLIDFITTDHSPAPPEIKAIDSGNFKEAWGGIASLQYSLNATWTIFKNNEMSLPELSEKMSANPAKFLSLDHKKGQIKLGYDADLVIWNPEEKYIASADKILHKHKISPYVGQELYGTIKQTFVNGQLVYNCGRFENLNQGELILNKI